MVLLTILERSVSSFLFKGTTLRSILAILLGFFFFSSHAAESKVSCDDKQLLQAVFNLMVQVNKLPETVTYEISSIKEVADTGSKAKKGKSKNLSCIAHLTLKQSDKVVDNLDLSYGIKSASSGETQIFFNPVRP